MIYEMLYPWQKKIVDKYKDRDSFGLFLDMGLGKTPLSLGFTEINQCSKVIVITINSKAKETIKTPGSWYQWALKSNIDYNIKDKTYSNFEINENDFLVINYEALFDRNVKSGVALKPNLVNFIKSCANHTTAIIIDESHKTKNLQSKQTQAIIKLKKSLDCISKKTYIYLLTGTPFTTGFIDLYTQLKLLGCDMTKSSFINDFCIKGNLPGLLGWQQPIIGYKNIDKLYSIIHRYAITIKSEDVIDLPDKIFKYHTTPMSLDFKYFIHDKLKGVDINKKLKKLKVRYDESLYITNSKVNNPFYRNIDYPNNRWIADTPSLFWLRCRQLSIGFQGSAEEFEWFDRSRLNLLKDFLKNNEDNYLLFYNYTPELLELYDICEELKYNIDVYCGEIKSLVFYERYCSMNEAKKLTNKKNIILANFASGSTGMNWQEYNKCIIFSTPLYKDYEQGIKRIHRLGQKSTVVYHIFNQNNWLDKSMEKALNDSIDYSKDMFEDDLLRIQKLLEEK